MYEALISQPNVAFGSYNSWKRVLENFCEWEAYLKAFKQLYVVTNSVKLRDFQYRLLHKRVPCNKVLYRWKIKSKPECDFCSMQGTIVHTLLECIHVHTFWTGVKSKCHDIAPAHECDFNYTNIIINKVHSKAGHLVNLYVLVAKQLIYRHKCKAEKIRIDDFNREIKFIHEVELYNARRSDKIVQHKRKWEKSGMKMD